MSSCICPACVKHFSYQFENFGWGFKNDKLNLIEEKGEKTSSPSSNLYLTFNKKHWKSHKYTSDISTGISSKNKTTIVSYSSSSSDDSSDSESEWNSKMCSCPRVIEVNLDQLTQIFNFSFID